MVQYINPHYMFGLPIQEKKREDISNDYVSIDKNGYRTTFPSYHFDKKDSSRKCILILGGSTAFGHGVSSDRNTFSSFIQSKIGEDYQVFNLATPSWNSRQELISVINFLSRPVSKKCNSIDTISITGANDISVTRQYLNSTLIKNDSDAIEYISAPESFSLLIKQVDNIGTKNNDPVKLTNDLLKSIFNITLGELYVTLRKFSIRKLYSSIKYKINLSSTNFLSEDMNLLSINDKKFINNQMNAFWKNHIFIANIINKKSQFGYKNRHLVVLQPSLKHIETKSIRSFANQRISDSLKNQTLPKNFNILDLREFSLKDKKQQTSLSKSIMNRSSQLNKDELLNLNYFDNFHLTDIGIKRAGEIVLNDYLLNKSKD